MSDPVQSYQPSTTRVQSTQSVRHNPLQPVPGTNHNVTNPIIAIPIKIECCRETKYSDAFPLCVSYVSRTTVGQILKAAIQRLNTKHDPLKFNCITFFGKSFISHANSASAVQNPITNYNRDHLTTDGIHIQVILTKYEHKINDTPITCKYMLAYHRRNGEYKTESCPIYHKMKHEYDHNAVYLLHLKNYNHFFHEFNDKPPCRYADQCFAFGRLEQNGFNFDDLCHMQVYRHPPRQNTIHLKSNINPLLINTKRDQNHLIYEPTADDEKEYTFDSSNGYLNALIEEVIKNGYEECLHLEDEDEEELRMNQDENDRKYSLLSIVNEKMTCLRHKKMALPLNRAQMLSIVLYTGTDCNYLLCKKQRKGDYNTWKWFDYCLYNAIRLLSIHETAEYKLYSGLRKVKLDKKEINEGFFKTYVSSSWKLEIARKFVKDDGGMVIVMDKEFRKHTYCCDVSWISKFQDECEVLISRSFSGVMDNVNNFSLRVMDNVDDVQIVSLYFKP